MYNYYDWGVENELGVWFPGSIEVNGQKSDVYVLINDNGIFAAEKPLNKKECLDMGFLKIF